MLLLDHDSRLEVGRVGEGERAFAECGDLDGGGTGILRAMMFTWNRRRVVLLVLAGFVLSGMAGLLLNRRRGG